MKFYSLQFPNITATFGNITIKFENGIYETTDPKEIEVLTYTGCFTHGEEDKKEPEKEPEKSKTVKKKAV